MYTYNVYYVQEVKLDSHISLLDSPGVMFDMGDTESANESLLLRNCLRVEQLDDPITAINGIVKRCTMEQLQSIYGIEPFTTTEEFVSLVAGKRGKLGKVCTYVVLYHIYSIVVY